MIGHVRGDVALAVVPIAARGGSFPSWFPSIPEFHMAMGLSRGFRAFAYFAGVAVVSLACSASLVGCSSFSERHYFKSVGPDGEAVNYYRVRVDGHSALSSSRYVSGYFDEAAVDAYFNEINQPAKAALVPAKRAARPAAGGAGGAAAAPSPSSEAGAKETVQPIGADTGKSLVLILSSNADAIADQIGAFASNREMTATLGRLLNRDKIEASTKAADSLADTKAQGDTIAGLGDSMVKTLADANADQAKTNQTVLSFLNAFAREFGNTTPFADVAAAKKWLDENRGRIAAAQE
jgi:hypothetical protein